MFQQYAVTINTKRFIYLHTPCVKTSFSNANASSYATLNRLTFAFYKTKFW